MSEFVEVTGTVKEVGAVEAKGEYKISKIQVECADGVKELSVFVDDVMDITVGQQIVCKVKPKDYKGKMQYSATRKYMKVFNAPKGVVKETPVALKTIAEKVADKVDRDGKEKRMVRMNSMSHATELVKSLFEIGEEDKIKKLFSYAEEIEKWIYR